MRSLCSLPSADESPDWQDTDTLVPSDLAARRTIWVCDTLSQRADRQGYPDPAIADLDRYGMQEEW
jgi:hypothetical protein